MDTVKMFLALGALLFIVSSVDGHNLRIASYNIKVFGAKKQKDPVAMNIITTIIRKYDVIQLQEVQRNLDIGILMEQVGTEYDICSSQLKAKVGEAKDAFKSAAFKPCAHKSSHREMYLFLYRTEVVKCLGTLECEDIKPDCPAESFRRPPTAALFEIAKGQSAGIKFFVAGIHTQPEKGTGVTVAEIESLPEAYNAFLNAFGGQTKLLFGAVMGDFNYGGEYVPKKSMDNLAIDSQMTRLIDKSAQTSVMTGYPYDRIYVTKGTSMNLIFHGDVDTDKGGLTTSEQYYKTVSDHYPVYFEVDIDLSGKQSSQDGSVEGEEDLNKAIYYECVNSLTEMGEMILQAPQLKPAEFYGKVDVIFVLSCYECCNIVQSEALCQHIQSIARELCKHAVNGEDIILQYWCSLNI